MSRRRKTRYSGELNQPIVRPLGLLYSANSPTGARWALEEQLLKLPLLLDHYAIKPSEPECGLRLAFMLAQIHVPGFQVVDNAPKGKGAPRKPSDVTSRRAQENVRIIDKAERERGKGVRDAIRTALKRKQLKGSAKSLEARYYENKDLLGRVEELERRLPKGFDPNLK